MDSVLSPFIGLPGHGLVADPWDLLALLMFPVPILVGYKWRGKVQNDGARLPY